MINLNEYFKQYNEKIKLDDTREEQLRTSREALKSRIESHFEKIEKHKPDFKGQGSFKMKTIINPKEEGDEYDIDYGVYISDKDIIKDDGNWKTVDTVRNWVYEAVDGHTSQKPICKNKCIRVKYAQDSNGYLYHVDLPIYTVHNDEYYLAVGDEGWINSNPQAIVDWFRDEIKEKEQLRRIVRYLKSWVKLKSWNTTKPSGLITTILCANHFNNGGLPDDDDIALCNTIQGIRTFLEDELKKDEGNYCLVNPAEKTKVENLFEDYSKAALTAFKDTKI